MTATLPAAATATATDTATVLIVEDDPGIAELERGRLEDAGYRVRVVGTAEEALREVGRGSVDLVLLDYRLPGGTDGLEFYARVKAAGYDLPVILVTGFSNEATVIQALRIGVRDFVTKSLEYLDYLPEAVGRVLRQVGMERRLAESEARLAGVIGSAKDAVIVVEADRRVSLFNPAAERMFGCAATDAIGRLVTDFIPDEFQPVADVPPGADPGSLTYRLRTGTRGERAGGEGFPVEASVSTGRAGGRKFYTLVVRDITERKLAEETLRRSESLLRRAEAMAHLAGWTYEVADGAYVSSEEGCRICGTPPGPHGSAELADTVHPDDRDRVNEAMQTALRGTPIEFEHRLVVDQRVKWVSVRAEPEVDESGRVVRIIGVTQDITARHLLEEQFRQAQKMEAFGQLAGGVAHDFNNLLTVINGFSGLALAQLDPDDPTRAMIDEVFKAGERAALLTRQLLVFSRKEIVAPRLIDLNAVVDGAGRMLTRLVGETICLHVAMAPALPAVKADPGQVEQVVMNLVVNARDAMPTGGKLTIETAVVELDRDYTLSHAVVLPGRYVLLAVADTGVGMTEEVRKHLFEPFFTTKGVGRGTGLGLATVYGIVRQWGGHLGVYTEVGRGSTFKVYLPATDESATATADARRERGPRGTETVLLVEDERSVRGLAREVLQASGYTVLEAESGEAAVAFAQRHAGTIHLLVTDVVMPGMDGRQVAERVAALRPGLHTLFLSGYTDDAVVRHGILSDGVAFLQKPFNPTSLAWKVREVLDKSRQASSG